MASIKVYDALTGEPTGRTYDGEVVSIIETRNGFGFASIKLHDGQFAHRVCVKLAEAREVAFK